MNTLDQLGRGLLAVIVAFFAFILGALDALENAVAGSMMRLGIPHDVQTVIFVVIAVLFLIAVFRVFGGLIRAALIVLLVILLVHVFVHDPSFNAAHHGSENIPGQL